jgi:hypothetical protein
MHADLYFIDVLRTHYEPLSCGGRSSAVLTAREMLRDLNLSSKWTRKTASPRMIVPCCRPSIFESTQSPVF